MHQAVWQSLDLWESPTLRGPRWFPTGFQSQGFGPLLMFTRGNQSPAWPESHCGTLAPRGHQASLPCTVSLLPFLSLIARADMRQEFPVMSGC